MFHSYFFCTGTKKDLSHLTQNLSIFNPQKLLLSSQKYGLDLGSGKSLFRILDPGVKNHRIADADPQHCVQLNVQGVETSSDGDICTLHEWASSSTLCPSRWSSLKKKNLKKIIIINLKKNSFKQLSCQFFEISFERPLLVVAGKYLDHTVKYEVAVKQCLYS